MLLAILVMTGALIYLEDDPISSWATLRDHYRECDWKVILS
jgi:hypothetical protein